MIKPRCDSHWNNLTPEQKQTLEQWLLEDNLGYPEVLKRVREQWGLTASKSSLARYYRRLAKKWLPRELEETQGVAEAAQSVKMDLPTLREAMLKVVSHRAMEVALREGESRELTRLAGLLMQEEQQEIQRAWLRLANKRFEFRASRAALEAVPLVNEFKQQEEELERVRVATVRRILFGDAPKKGDPPRKAPPAPENPSEPHRTA